MVASLIMHSQLLVVSSIVLSAGTYLFDFGSNLVVLVEYSQRYISLLRREAGGIASCDATCRVQTSEVAGYFYGLLGIMACCHSLNAILFKLKFKHSDAPICVAYFLPLIHLYRLSNLLWRTLSCAGVQELRCPEMNGLYCILGSAMEGVPMLILQFCGSLVLTRESIFGDSMSDTFKVSVAASLISAAYNGGASVQSVAKNAVTLKHKIWAGMTGGGFTLCAALLRCLTFTNVIVHIREHFSQQRTVREQAKFHVSDSLPLLVIGGCMLSYLLHFWLLHSPKDMMKNVRDVHRLLSSLSFSFMSMILGPPYPMISLASDASQLGGCIFRVKLLATCLLHVLLDAAVVCVTRLLGMLPTPYLLVSTLTIAGYLGFLISYLRLDACCGPNRVNLRDDGDGWDGEDDGDDDDARKAEAVDMKLPLNRSSIACGEVEAAPCPSAAEHGDADAEAEKSGPLVIRCLSLDRREVICARKAEMRRWGSNLGLSVTNIVHPRFKL
ncbi:hypothetical protein L7F22_016761 [Adiantum nelumboides]|nr:hypothetical protein [Adiantum nelumboides]